MTTKAGGKSRSRIRFLLLSTLAAFAACGDSPTASQRQLSPSAPSQMVVVSGDGQAAPAGTQLPAPVVVRVLDGEAAPVANQVVNFRVTAGGGSVFAGTAITDANGIAQERWTLGSPGTPQALEARAVDAATGGKQVFANFTATAVDPATIVASVAVSPAAAELTVGGTRQLNAVAQNSAGGPVPGKTFQWSSSNAAVATVSSTGLVTARAAGSATISAATEGHTGAASIEVAALPAVDTDPPGAPGVPALSYSAQTSDSVTVSASWSAAADAVAYEWSTGSNSGGFTREGSAATTSTSFRAPLSEDTTGFWFCVKARDEAGNVGTESACNNYDTPANSTVDPSPTVAAVAVTPATSSLAVGGTSQLSATAREADGSAISGKTFTWTSSNPTVVTVSTAGLVTARAAGAATITAQADGVSGTAGVTVTATAPVVATVAVSPSSATLDAGSTRQLAAAARDAAGNTISGKTFSWSSSNSSVATVSAAGLITAGATGSAVITASVDGKSGTATITVPAAPPPPTVVTVVLSPASATVSIGATRQVTATAQDGGGIPITGKTFSWSSSNATVATVSASGLVTALAAGSATITASVDGVSGRAAVTVPAPPPPPIVAAVAVSPTSATLSIGATRQLGAIAQDASGNAISGKSFSWTSSNTGVATVSAGGLVTARAAGSATITASVDGKSSTAAITVSAGTGGGGTTAKLVEDFSSYGSTAEMLQDPRGLYVESENIGTGQMLLDASVGYGASSRSLRYTHTNGQTITRAIDFAALGVGDELWTEIVVRFSPGWVVGAAYKLLHLNTNLNNGARFGLNFENGTGGSLNGEAPSADYDAGHLQTVASSSLFDGEWHTVRYHTQISGSQVFHEIWVDGEYEGSRGPLTARSGGHNFEIMKLGANMNESNGQTQHLWWGRVSVWTADPGW